MQVCNPEEVLEVQFLEKAMRGECPKFGATIKAHIGEAVDKHFHSDGKLLSLCEFKTRYAEKAHMLHQRFKETRELEKTWRDKMNPICATSHKTKNLAFLQSCFDRTPACQGVDLTPIFIESSYTDIGFSQNRFPKCGVIAIKPP